MTDNKVKYLSRRLILPTHLNHHGTLFGGQLMSFIDEEAAIYAACVLGFGTSLVTAFISQINFISPAKNGEVIEFGMDVVSIGNSSITVNCVVRNKTNQTVICEVDKVVMVSVDEDGKSKPHGKAKC